jgi:hypothetical protein
MNIANLGVGIVLAFVYSWAITLLIILFVPFMIISGVIQTKLMVGFSSKDKKNLEEAGKVRTLNLFLLLSICQYCKIQAIFLLLLLRSQMSRLATFALLLF